nr:hypothetical protein CFP56_69199 [Quercus suber]
MDSNQVMLQVSEQQATESDLSMNQIPATHAHADKDFDIESLLAGVKNIIDNVLVFILKKEKYLAVLDDFTAENENAWKTLKAAFQETDGSRILLTTQDQCVARTVGKDVKDPKLLEWLQHIYPDLKQWLAYLKIGSSNFLEDWLLSQGIYFEDWHENLRKIYAFFNLFPRDYEIPTRRLVALSVAEELTSIAQHRTISSVDVFRLKMDLPGGNLLNLQTLDVKHIYVRTLPKSIWKLHKLRHLYLNQSYRSKFVPQPRSSSLKNLQTLWGLFWDDFSAIKNGLNKLTKLGLAFRLESPEQKNALVKLVKGLIYLKSLR